MARNLMKLNLQTIGVLQIVHSCNKFLDQTVDLTAMRSLISRYLPMRADNLKCLLRVSKYGHHRVWKGL